MSNIRIIIILSIFIGSFLFSREYSLYTFICCFLGVIAGTLFGELINHYVRKVAN